MSKATSVRLTDDLAARIEASGLTLPALIARGLDCPGHRGGPLAEITARLDQLEHWQAAHERLPHRRAAAAEQRATDRLDQLPPDPFTIPQAAQIWACSITAARQRLGRLEAASLITRLDDRQPAAPAIYRRLSPDHSE